MFVIAENYEDARTFAYKQGCHYSSLVYVYNKEKLYGLRGVKLYVTHAAKFRKEYALLLQEAKIRGLDLKHAE